MQSKLQTKYRLLKRFNRGRLSAIAVLLSTTIASFVSGTLAATPQEQRAAKLERAENLMYASRFQDAIQTLDGLIRANPGDSEALILMGRLYWRLGDISEENLNLAEKYFVKATNADSKCSRAYRYLASLSLLKGAAPEAEKLCEVALNCPSPDPESLKVRAEARSALRKDKPALKDISDFIKQGKGVKQADFLLQAGILENLKDYPAALKIYNQLLKTKYSDNLMMLKARCLERQGSISEAISSWQAASNHNKLDSLPHFEMAKLYERKGNLKAALASAGQAIELEPSPTHLKFRAAIYRKLGQESAAIRDTAAADRF